MIEARPAGAEAPHRARGPALGLVACLLLSAAWTSARAADPAATPAQLSADDEVVLALRSDRTILAEAMTGYAIGGKTYLPLGELARALDLAIVVRDQRASGWFIREQRRFELDLAAGRVTVAGRENVFPPGGAIAREGEIFVRIDLLEAWFPLRLVLDPAAASVAVVATEPLPFQERIAREAKTATLGGTGEDYRLTLPIETTPYRFFTPPSVDLNIRASTGDPLRNTYDARLTGDLGWLGANLYLAGDGEDALSDVRLVLGRRDSRGIGFLGLTQFAVGDVFAPDLPNGLRSAGGRGFIASNEVPGSSVLLDHTDVRGELPLGWQAELYRNGILVGSQLSGVGGLYEFREVKLNFGLNTLKVVLYGPRGERREEVRLLRLGEDTLAPGTARFRVGAVQVDTPLFGTVGRSELLSGFEPVDRGRVQASFLGEYGLARNLTLAGHFGTRPNLGRNDVLGGLGLRTTVRGASLRIDGDVVDDGSAALSASVLTRLYGVDLAVDHAEYSGGFRDDRRSFDDNVRLRSATTVRADSLLKLRGFEAPLSLEVEHRRRIDGSDDLLATARSSFSFGRLLISGGVRYQHRPLLDDSTDQVDGDVSANTPFLGGLARLAIDYEVRPDGRLRTAALSWDKYFTDRLSLRTEISQGLTDDASTRAQLGLTRRFNRFDATLEGGYDTGRQEALLGFRLSTSFGWRGDRYTQMPPGFATGGAAAVSVYQDRNGDGVRQPDEPPVAGVKVAGGAGRIAVTGADGIALVGGLGEGRPAAVVVAPGSIEDPFLKPSRLGFRVLPRAGRVHRSAIGLISTAEVETSVVYEEVGARAVSNVALVLVDDKGRVAAEVRSEYDGFVLFQGVSAGRYHLRLQAEQAAQLGLTLVEEPIVVVSPAGGSLKAPNLRVRRAGAAGAPTRPPKEAETFVFRDAQLKNAAALSPEALARIFAPYRGQTLTLADVRKLAVQIEDVYQASGYPFVVVVVPPQTVHDGVVELEVIEGRISDLTILGLDPVARRQATSAFGGLVDRRPLSMADAEGAYGRARAVPGLTITGALRRGGKPGGMDLVVQAKRQSWRVYTNVNNLYPEAVGPWGGLLVGEYNGASTWGDQTTLQLYSTFDVAEQQLFRAAHTRRFNASGTQASLSFLYAQANPKGDIAPLDLATNVTAGRLEIAQPVPAVGGWSVLGALALDWTDQDTRIFSRDINGRLTEDHLRTLLIRGAGDWVRNGREVHLSAEVRKGLDFAGASGPGDFGLSRADANPQALVVRASASGEAPLFWKVRLGLRFEGQWTADSLTAPEEFTVGSLTVGRGYQPGSAFGDSAAAIVIEPRFGPFRLRRDGFTVEPYVFYDGALVFNQESSAPNGRLVSSVGAGLRFEIAGRARIDLGYAVPLDAPLGLGEVRPEPRLLVNLTTSLTEAAGTVRNVFGALRRTPSAGAPR